MERVAMDEAILEASEALTDMVKDADRLDNATHGHIRVTLRIYGRTWSQKIGQVIHIKTGGD